MGVEIVDLVQLSDMLGLHRLRWFALQFLQKKIDMASALSIVKGLKMCCSLESHDAAAVQAQEEFTKNISLRYICEHYTDFIKDSTASKRLGLDVILFA